jgi:rod shape-determining protein MreB
VHIAVPEGGVVVREPTIVAFAPHSHKPVALGREARRLWERGVTEVQIIHPVRGGVVADFDGTVALLRQLVQRALGRRPWIPPQVVVSVPADISPVAQRALFDSLHASGCGHVITVSKPLAAALGAGLTSHDEETVLVVDIGGGATDVGLFSAGLVTAARTIAWGGETLDESILRAVRRESGLKISEATAEQIKEQVSSVNGWSGAASVSVSASDDEALDVAPHDLDAAQVPHILAEAFETLIGELLWTVEALPRNVQHELTQGGVILTGGGALLRGVEELVRNTLHLPVAVATDPVSCTILGLEAVMRDLPALSLQGRAFGASVG